MSFKKNDQVFGNMDNPVPGFIKRVSKDGEWADVEWHIGIKCLCSQRVKTSFLINLDDLFSSYHNILKITLDKNTTTMR